MTLSSLTFKNIKHNIKNYGAYLLGNSFIIGILLMFFSLVFSNEFMAIPETSPIKENFISMVGLMIAFSVAFIMYTTVSFTKFRGKEFGVYFTIGLTSKNIMKILIYENLVISSSAFILGGTFGSIFMKLFHMGIMKVLNIKNIDIGFAIEPYIAVAAIAIMIFLFSIVYQCIFLTRISIVDILKSTSKKDIGKGNLIVGAISIMAIIVSMVLFHMAVYQKIEKTQIAMVVSIVMLIIALYFAIGSAMTFIEKILRNFKGLYNNNILSINSLSHRFVSYRGVLYIITLLVAGGMTFISIAYGMYKSTEKYINTDYPYDLSFIVDKEDLAKYDYRNMVKEAGADISAYIELETLQFPDVRILNGETKGYGPSISVVSEENYSKLKNEKIKIEKSHSLYGHREKTDKVSDFQFLLDVAEDSPEGNPYDKLLSNRYDLKEYIDNSSKEDYLYINKDNIKDIGGNITNLVASQDYIRLNCLILNDEDYERLKDKINPEKITYDVLVNLNNSKEGNNIGKDLVKAMEKSQKDKVINSLIIKEKKMGEEINRRGFALFMSTFMGTMLILGSAVVLYFKVFTSLEDDKIRANQLVKIGLTDRDIKKVIKKELRAIFLLPPIIAIALISYYLSTLYSMIPNGEYLWQTSVASFGFYILVQSTFYIITTKKYLTKIK